MLIIFDENFPHNLARGLGIIEESNHKSSLRCQITHPKYLNIEGMKDNPLIHYAGTNNAIIITSDRDFRDIKSKGRIYIENKVGIFFFKFKKNESNYWGIVKLFINQFDNIKEILRTTDAPFIYEISSAGVKRFEF